jgi:hypothetical protein
MTTLALIRFGQTPNPIVSQALAPHIIGKAVAVPVPGAILSVFNTESSVDDVRESVQATGVFFILSDRAQLALPQPLMDAIADAFPNDGEPAKDDKPLTMDEILDLISQNGIESLTSAQKQQLENLR